MQIYLINPNLDCPPIPSFGLAYVISSIEEYHKVRLLDMGFHAKRYQDYIIGRLKESRPDVIGMSVTSFSFRYALKIAAIIKKLYPDIPLVYGGVHPTLLPEETIQNPLVDAICIGEGEDSFKEYLDRLKNNRSPEGVAGIWYKDKPGEVVRNPLRPFREDLDSLPFPNWDYWDIEKYLRLNESFVGALRIFSSRGCPYSCSFCSSSAIRKAVPGRFYRLRSPENIIKEISSTVEKYYNKGFRHLTFGDDIFGLNLEHLRKLCSLYIKAGFSDFLSWGCQTRVEMITEDWASTVSKAGCIVISLGIETGDENIRMNVYNKKITDKQIMNAVKILERHNIKYCLSMIMGCPEDSKESVYNSFKLVKSIKSVASYFTFYKPLPKTALCDSKNIALNYIQRDSGGIWNTPKLTTRYLNKWDLQLLVIKLSFLRGCNFIKLGIELRGMRFALDLFRYIFRMDNSRISAINSPYLIVEMESKTLYKYFLEDWKKKHLMFRGAK